MTLADIIQEFHALETKLVQLEKRYNLRSPDFYHLYKAGEWEQSREFIGASGNGRLRLLPGTPSAGPAKAGRVGLFFNYSVAISASLKPVILAIRARSSPSCCILRAISCCCSARPFCSADWISSW